MRKMFALPSLLIVFSMVLAACGGTPTATQAGPGAPTSAPATPPPAPAGPKVLHLNMGPGDVPTIDPALTTDTSSVQVVDETTVGLTRQNEETTAVEPGMATSWMW